MSRSKPAQRSTLMSKSANPRKPSNGHKHAITHQPPATLSVEDDNQDRGPAEWLTPFLELRASRLIARGSRVEPIESIAKFRSTLQPNLTGSEARSRHYPLAIGWTH